MILFPLLRWCSEPFKSTGTSLESWGDGGRKGGKARTGLYPCRRTHLAHHDTGLEGVPHCPPSPTRARTSFQILTVDSHLSGQNTAFSAARGSLDSALRPSPSFFPSMLPALQVRPPS